MKGRKMNSLIKTIPNVKKFNDFLFDVKKDKTPIMLSGLTDVGKVHMAYATRFYTENLYVLLLIMKCKQKRL